MSSAIIKKKDQHFRDVDPSFIYKVFCERVLTKLYSPLGGAQPRGATVPIKGLGGVVIHDY